MKHAEFTKALSSRLSIRESEVKTLLRANRKILKKRVKIENGFLIPALGLFKKHPALKLKEYSHYHGYELLTKLKKILRFYPESFSGRKPIRKVVVNSDIADELAVIAGVSGITSQRFLNETAALIKEGLERDNRVFVSGVGLFKMARQQYPEKVKDIRNDNKVIQFKADAGLRNNILKSNDPVIQKQNSGVQKTDVLGYPQQIMEPVMGSTSELQRTITENHKKTPGKAAHSKDITGYTPEKMEGLSKETFSFDKIDIELKEKHLYFEWIIIVVFLIILASGIYLIKPPVESSNEFNTRPFDFSEVSK